MNGQRNENGPARRDNDDTGPGQHLGSEGAALVRNIQVPPTDSPFEPGDGWREVDRAESLRAKTATLKLDDLPYQRYWVREDSVAALPTEPYTVIRVEWAHPVMDGAPPILWLNVALDWSDGRQWYSPGVLGRNITEFEVLSEPRAVTAKAVLDRIRGSVLDEVGALEDTADEFGVGA